VCSVKVTLFHCFCYFHQMAPVVPLPQALLERPRHRRRDLSIGTHPSLLPRAHPGSEKCARSLCAISSFPSPVSSLSLFVGGYWERRRRAALHPNQSLSICVDGSDQINNGCPYYSEKTHAMEGQWKFRLHIYGVLVHGYHPYVYLLQNHVKQGILGVPHAFCALFLIL
jgi:hypothetical protein